MKVGAGGLQAHAVHDEVANRQAQENRRADLQPRPVKDSEAAAALNRNALNKTVERPRDTTGSNGPSRHLKRREEGGGRDYAENSTGYRDNRKHQGDDPAPRDETNNTGKPGLDKYI